MFMASRSLTFIEWIAPINCSYSNCSISVLVASVEQFATRITALCACTMCMYMWSRRFYASIAMLSHSFCLFYVCVCVCVCVWVLFLICLRTATAGTTGHGTTADCNLSGSLHQGRSPSPCRILAIGEPTRCRVLAGRREWTTVRCELVARAC